MPLEPKVSHPRHKADGMGMPLELVALYPDRGELAGEFPELESEDIRQALTYAAANLDDKSFEFHGA